MLPSDPPARVSAVPRRLRLICASVAAVVVAVAVGVALSLPDPSDGSIEYGPVDQVAIIGVGLFLGAGVLSLASSRVDADAARIRVRNLYVTRELPWTAVRTVRFERKSSWASLGLTNDDTLSLLAVQAADKEHAVTVVEGLRALLAANRATEPPRPPLLHEN